MTTHQQLMRLAGLLAATLSAVAAQAQQAILAGLQPAVPGDGDGGRIEMSAADVANVRRAREAVEKLLESPYEASWIRRDAAAALQRLHEALNDWGRRGQLEWYIGRLLAEPAADVRRSLMPGAVASAKGGNPHLGGVRAFWRTLDALTASRPDLLAEGVDQERRYVGETESELRRVTGLVPDRLEPYRLSLPDLDVSGKLRPFTEPDDK